MTAAPTVDTAVPILLYHSINDRPAAGQERFTVRPTLFREHVQAISDAGRAPLTLGEFATALRGECELPPRPILLTFDDGFADSRAAVELLLGADLKASVFVTSGSIGRDGMLTANGVRELAALGERVELGAHTVSHPRLDELSVGRASQEIRASKAALEELLQAGVHSFAYPHGAYNRRVRGAVIDAGFTAAAAVKNALSHSRDDPYALARMTVNATTQARHIELLLCGLGARIVTGRERLRTRGYRAVRRVRRRLGTEAA